MSMWVFSLNRCMMSTSFWCHFFILLLCVSLTIESNTISLASNAVQITENTFVDDVGVLFVLEANLNQSHRRLVDDSSCSTPPYTSSCTSTNPSCPCTALTSSEKQSILDAHNTRRSLAASGSETCADSSGQPTAQCPSASNMNYLFWDDGLSVVATYWAHQCNWGHHQDVIPNEQNTMYKVQCDSSSCLSPGYTDGWIGENLAAAGDSRPDWSIDHALNGIKSWFDESKYYDFDERTSYGVTGHWTQGVWAATRYIGCGYAACSSGSPFSITEWFNFVCKYYPGGNYPTQPYTKGETCNECSDDRNLCADGLCGGGQCSSCAVDFNQNRCNYNASWCPSEMLCDDGVGRTVNCGSDLWDQQSERALVAGVVGSFFTLIIVFTVLVLIIYYQRILKEDKYVFVLIFTAFVLFLLPPISFAFIKDNVVKGDQYHPHNSCKIAWFLEYFGYEIGKLLVAVFLIYRFYCVFNDDCVYRMTKQHIKHIFSKFVPFLGFMYFILILLAFLLKNQFEVIVSMTAMHLYCGYQQVNAVFVFGNITSFIREIAFSSIVLYFYLMRLCHGKKEEIEENVDIEKNEEITENDEGDDGDDNGVIWKQYMDKHGKEPQNCMDFHAFCKLGDDNSDLSYKEAKQIFDKHKNKTKSATKTQKKVKKVKKVQKAKKEENVDGTKALLMKHVILIVIMFLSSFISQILLCIIKYPSFYISWDIIIQCMCSLSLLPISKTIWIMLCRSDNICCPVCNKQSQGTNNKQTQQSQETKAV